MSFTGSHSTSDAKGALNIKLTAKFAFLLEGVLASFALTGLAPVLPAIAEHFTNFPNVGFLTRLLVTVISLTAVIGGPLAGLCADFFGRRRIFLIDTVVYAIAGCAGVFVDNLYALIGTRVILGLAAATSASIMLAIIATRSTGTARARWMGYISTVSVLCTATLIPLSGFLGSYGWRWPFLIHLVSLLPFAFAFHGLERDEIRSANQRDKPRFSLANRGAFGLVATAAAVGALQATPMLYIPFHIRELGVEEPSRIAVAVTLWTLGFAMTAFFYGSIRRRLSIASVFSLAFCASAISLLSITFVHTYEQMLIAVYVTGLSGGLLPPNVFNLGSETGSDSQRGQMMGLARAGLYLGPLVMQLILEPMIKHVDANMAIRVLGYFGCVLLLVSVFRVQANAAKTARTAYKSR
jgi:MFS family permease